MKDNLMLEFYKGQSSFDEASFAKWRGWCIDHGEQAGSYPEFVGRLKRCHLAQLRTKPARHGRNPNVRVGP